MANDTFQFRLVHVVVLACMVGMLIGRAAADFVH
jgi:hypothetical protein